MKYTDLIGDKGQVTGYEISNGGIIRDKHTKEILEPRIVSRRKYNDHYIYLKSRPYATVKYLDDGKYHTNQVGRWVMLSFNPIKHSKRYEVNHKDGNPMNNRLSNLEWVSRKGNMKHAADHNLLPYGENHHNSKYSNDLIKRICEDIVDEVSRSEICAKYKVNGQLIDDIRSGRSHKKISKKYVKYGFVYKTYDNSESIQLTMKICELIESGLSNSEIVCTLGLTNKCLPNDIRKKRVYKYISKDYDF